MTPKNKKKFRKEIADGKKNSAAGVRFSRKKLSDDDYQRRDSSDNDRSFERGGKRTSGKNENFRRRDDDKKTFGRKNFKEERYPEKREYIKRENSDNYRGRNDERKPYIKRETSERYPDKRDGEKRPYERKNYSDKNFGGKRTYQKDDRRTDGDKKPYQKRGDGTFNDYRNRNNRNPDERKNTGSKRYEDRSVRNEREGYREKPDRRFNEEKKFEKRETSERKNYERKNFDDSRHRKQDDGKFERREYIKKINFEEDRQGRFIDDESPLKKSRKKTDDKKYSTYEYDPGKTKKIYKEEVEEMRLNKYLAHCGVAARRKADEFIENGLVKVNGEIIKEMGHKVRPGDEVRYKGKVITPENKVYILLNKPKDFITTADDEKGRKTVMELIEGATDERVYPVGRLDRNTTGLLLLTNDGEIAQKLSHPSHGAKKVYAVELDKPLSENHMKKIAEGIELEDGMATVDEIAYADLKNNKVIGVMLHVGKNRIVRRIFESLGYSVEKLDRTFYAGLDKKNIERGKWRFLSDKEIIMLKRMR